MPGLKLNFSNYNVTWSNKKPFIQSFIYYKDVEVYALYSMDVINYAQIYYASRLISVKPSQDFVYFLRREYDSWKDVAMEDIIFMVHEDKAKIIEGDDCQD